MIHKKITLRYLKHHVYKFTGMNKDHINVIITTLIEEIKKTVKEDNTVSIENFFKLRNIYYTRKGTKYKTIRCKFHKKLRDKIFNKLKD